MFNIPPLIRTVKDLKLFADWLLFMLAIVVFQNHLLSDVSGIQSDFRVSNSLDRAKAQYFVRIDLSPNCLQRLTADDTSLQSVKVGMY